MEGSVIEAALADINKDFTSTLEIEGEKLRNSIKDHGQELRVKKLAPELSQEWQTAGVMERSWIRTETPARIRNWS